MKKKVLSILLIFVVAAAAVAVALLTKVPIPAGFQNKIRIYTRNKPDVEVTVAVITPAETKIKAYGHDGKEIPVPDMEYEIGQITKTFTGILTAKAVSEDKFTLNTKVSDILDIEKGIYSPTIYQLVTHTSAYGDFTPSSVSALKLKAWKNPFSGFDGNDLVRAATNFRLNMKPTYFYSYSDFGTAILGTAIAKTYETDFCTLLTEFVQDELGMKNTYVTVSGSLPEGWAWHYDDAYIASSGLVSNIYDMISYAKLYIGLGNEFMNTAAAPQFEINMETSVGYLWGITKDGVLEQSGETSHYASQITIDRARETAVIVLSNYGNDRYGDVSDLAAEIYSEIITDTEKSS